MLKRILTGPVVIVTDKLQQNLVLCVEENIPEKYDIN